MKLCDYGCGQEARFQFKNGKWCCSIHWKKCPEQRKRTGELNIGKKTGPPSEETKRKISKSLKGKSLSEEHKKKIGEGNKGKIISEETKKRMSKVKIGKILSKKTKRKIGKGNKFTLKDYKEKYPFLCNVEELRETKDDGVQVRCKNHNCKNSKEKDGWFTPTYTQIYERIRQLEHISGWGGSYFYCSQYCKDTCPLYYLNGDPYKDTGKPYTSTEKEVFNKHILKRDNEICYYCGEHATEVHHLRPQKLEPFFALDPDYAISACEKHHYKYGHPTGSKHSTGNLAKIVCSVESQKFLNQK